MQSHEIEAYFARLSELLALRNVVGEIVLFGGAAMVLVPKTRFAVEELCQELEEP